jgi:hypothetical protein
VTRISILAVSMAVTSAFATLGRLIRRTPPPQADILEAYAHEVIPVLDRAEWLYQYWLEQSTLFTDSEKLGNVAAIHRWETATMGRSLERVIPPAVLARAHEDVIDALEMASRAAQLLSNGSRFHNANAVCEGQSMLTTSRERRLVALRAMRRYLLNTPAAQTAEPEHDDEPVATDAAASPPVETGGLNGANELHGHPPDLAASTPDGSEVAAEIEAHDPDAYDDRAESVPAFLSAVPTPPAETSAPQPLVSQSTPEGAPEAPVAPPIAPVEPQAAAPASEAAAPAPPVPAPRSGWGSLFNRPGEPPRE